MIGLILSSILALAKDTGKVLFLLARQALLAFRVVRGHMAAIFLMQARAALLQLLLWGVLFALLQGAWLGLSALMLKFASWIDVAQSVANLAPYNNQGVFTIVWESLALDAAFSNISILFSAWLSGWGVYKSLEYASAIRGMATVKGFWGRI